MANMFSGNIEKEIPKDLKECCKTDAITHNLWVWCERLERWGFRICIALAVIGIITIISNAVETVQLLDELNIDMGEIRTAAAEYGIEIKSIFEIVVEGILTWTFYCFLEYCTYHVLALLIGSLATIIQNTKISANVAIYNLSKEESKTTANNEQQKEDTDKQNCDENSTVLRQQPFFTNSKDENNTMICPFCKFEQPIGRKVCWHCGAAFENNSQSSSTHKWLCDGCKRMRTQTPCEHCGKE